MASLSLISSENSRGSQRCRNLSEITSTMATGSIRMPELQLLHFDFQTHFFPLMVKADIKCMPDRGVRQAIAFFQFSQIMPQKPEWLHRSQYVKTFPITIWLFSQVMMNSVVRRLHRHTLILLHFICVQLPSVNRREGWQEMDVGEGKAKVPLLPSCWLLWGFSTSSCQMVFTIQLSSCSSGPPITFAFSLEG